LECLGVSVFNFFAFPVKIVYNLQLGRSIIQIYMITRRVSTKIPNEPPVRFYRTIAITFLIATIVLLGVVIFFTSKKATIVIAAKSDNKNVNLSVGIGEQTLAGVSIKGVVTTTSFSLTEKYYPTSNKLIDDIAVGEVTLYNDSGLDQPLIKTTRLLSPDKVLFRLVDGVNVPANGEVKAKVYADIKGADSNITATSFIIPGLSVDRQKYVYAKSNNPMMGGVKKVGVLTTEDLQAAKNSYLLKLKKSFLESNQTPPALKNKEKVIYVKGGDIAVDKKVGEEINEFNLSSVNTVAVVYYNKEELQSLVNGEVSKKIDTDSEKVLSVTKNPQVELINYDLSKNTARLSVYQDVLVTLDANGVKLAPVHFFGKRKDQIQRYVLGLGHVLNVDVKFSPSWMRTAPSVAEKIKVVVKNMK